ncbi:MAG TPA: inositol monophosphatase family protein [Casimicrobiaceae bacterium]|nr:inositol monophosphatase family protein [Casimicrobiaceae bacterium]
MASDERYAFAQAVARHAGALALEYWQNRERLTVELKGPQDFVSRADRDVEALIHRELGTAFPDDRFLGEETAAQFTGPIDRCWVVDPIDGTHNFLRGIAYWNVAIAYVEEGEAQIGVVFDPVSGKLYHAARGAGAWCDDAPGTARLQVAATHELAGAYVALGHHDRAPDARYLEIRRRMMESGVAMRNFGSAALQLAHVAAGHLDGFVELQISVWDAIGGLVLVDEAGGHVAPFKPATPTAKAACLACAPGIAPGLRAIVGI